MGRDGTRGRGVTFHPGHFPGPRWYLLIAANVLSLGRSPFCACLRMTEMTSCGYSGGWDWESRAGRRGGCPGPPVLGIQESPWAASRAAGPKGQDTVPVRSQVFLRLSYLGCILINQ